MEKSMRVFVDRVYAHDDDTGHRMGGKGNSACRNPDVDSREDRQHPRE